MAKGFIMRRIIVLTVTLSVVNAQSKVDSFLKEVFGIAPGNNSLAQDASDLATQCSGVLDAEAATGCYECYPCEHARIGKHRAENHTITTYRFRNSQCSTERVCCVEQSDLDQRSGTDCGSVNPDGIPRQRRPKVRSVLIGEHPWRTWVFKKNHLIQPLCAATFILMDNRAFMVPASCVQGLSADQLVVSFTRHAVKQSVVSQVLVHEGYSPGKHINDIAVLVIRSMESVPSWARPACLPVIAPPHALPCIAVSNQDYFINNGIPIKSVCSGEGNMDESQLCAVAPKGDYSPETGGGLFCVEQHIRFYTYTVYGMAIDKLDDALSIYTNVSHFVPWIEKKFNLNN